MRMKPARPLGVALGLLAVSLAWGGCNYRTETVPRVPAPAPGRDTPRENYEVDKPLPGEEGPGPRPRSAGPSVER